MAKFTSHTGIESPAELDPDGLAQDFEFSLNVVSHMSAELEQVQTSVSELVCNKINWPGAASDIQVSLQENVDSNSEYHMEDHTDTPSRSWTGSVSIHTDSPVDVSAMQSAALMAETENLVDDLGNIRFISLGEQ